MNIPMGLTAFALVPATASAASTPATAYVTNFNDNTVTPIDLATNTPGTPIPSAPGPSGSRSPPTGRPPMSPTKAAAR